MDEKGCFFFWVLPSKSELAAIFDPTAVFQYKHENVPRAFTFPYSKEFDKQLKQIAKKKEQNPGLLIFMQNKNDDRQRVKLIKYQELLVKDDS